MGQFSKKIPLFNDHERFLKNIIVSSDGCWNWSGCKSVHGYGRFIINGSDFKPHRISYSIFKGDLVDGLVIDHICKNKSCVNPDHLRQVTVAFNVLENSESIQAKNKKKEKCSRGHYFTLENTRIWRNERRCMSCEKINDLKTKNKRKESV